MNRVVFLSFNFIVMQDKRKATKTVNVTGMTEETRQWFIRGPLRFDYDLYMFVRQLFKQCFRKAFKIF